jgi:hypothetical protein
MPPICLSRVGIPILFHQPTTTVTTWDSQGLTMVNSLSIHLICRQGC